MSAIYDNWERLVVATMDREKLRELALRPSRETSFSSSIADDSDFEFSHSLSIDLALDETSSKLSFTVPIQLADQVIKAADEAAAAFRLQRSELKSKTEKLAALLRQAARASGDLYERPARRVIVETVQALHRALALVLKCRRNGLMKRVFTIIPAAAFRKMLTQLENSISNVSWLLHVSASVDDRAGEILGLLPIASNELGLGLPPIASKELILDLIREKIALLFTGSADDRANAAESLVSLARDHHRYGKLIIEEDGVGPLLKLAKEGNLQGRENAAMAIGLLGKDEESVEHMIEAGACQVFAGILKEGPMNVQGVVAWAVSEFVIHNPNCQDIFMQYNIIRLLVGHLAFETVQEQSKLDSVHKSREMEDPKTKERIKVMSARALWHLAKGNSPICRSITKSRALLCFAVLLEKGPEEIRYNSAMAVMEITAVAEEDTELRKSAFKPNSPACKALVDQLFSIIEGAEYSDLLIPCIKSIGNLAGTFKASETRMTGPLVNLLDEREVEVTEAACVALTKFAYTYNYLHLDHSKAIITAGGARHLVELVYFGETVTVQRHAITLLCYIAMHVPNSEGLAQVDALAVLEWASKQPSLVQEEDMESLLVEAKFNLGPFQSLRIKWIQ